MRILISSCVMGNSVRWNGSDRQDKDIEEWASAHGFTLTPVCPEDSLFGTPRPPIKLHKISDQVLAMMNSRNVYPELVSECKRILSEYPDVVGYIGIAGSPSCGISVGVKGAGSVMKAPMHAEAGFPTTEINSMKSPENRERFRERIMKWVNNQVKRTNDS